MNSEPPIAALSVATGPDSGPAVPPLDAAARRRDGLVRGGLRLLTSVLMVVAIVVIAWLGTGGSRWLHGVAVGMAIGIAVAAFAGFRGGRWRGRAREERKPRAQLDHRGG